MTRALPLGFGLYVPPAYFLGPLRAVAACGIGEQLWPLGPCFWFRPGCPRRQMFSVAA